MKVDVSTGELFDKITILQIKLERIKDQEKLKHIRYELDTLENILFESNIKISNDLLQKLRDTNETLWDTEDVEINMFFGSQIKEQKSYEKLY